MFLNSLPLPPLNTFFLQAPFMATFKVRKERTVGATDLEAIEDATEQERTEEYDVWQAAIFKVGDDCRQDVLALQVIAMFKNIFESVGLTLYLYPYRVTATGPGVRLFPCLRS
jgi:phosphatidylinositol 4-kinase A